MSDVEAILRRAEHRDEPPPARPWSIFQHWEDSLFLHWRLPAERLRGRVPAGLTLDEVEGQAWVSIVASRTRGSRLRLLPPVPGGGTYVGVNLRTYVRHGERPGVLFLSLDAGSRAAVLAARLRYGLPFHRARTMVEHRADRVHYRSVRAGDGPEPATFVAWCRPEGPTFEPAPGSFDHWTTERYRLFLASRGRIRCAEIHHPPWPLRRARVDVLVQTIGAAAGLPLEGPPERSACCAGVDTLLWSLR